MEEKRQRMEWWGKGNVKQEDKNSLFPKGRDGMSVYIESVYIL